MKAATIVGGRVEVRDVAEPVPAAGQALVRTHRCGLCASDAHFLHSGAKMVALSEDIGGPYAGLDLDRPFVPGHEFVGELIDYGPGTARPLKTGTRVTSAPILRHADGSRSVIGYSHDCPGGFGELMLLDEAILMAVPDAVDDDRAALIEPLAVGLEHARVGRPAPDDIILVVGCGAIGLGIIAGLKLMGVGPIIGTDFDPGRRSLAIAMGAHAAIDPREVSPYGPLPEIGNRRVTLVYEAAGAPGLLDTMMRGVGFGARIVMGGHGLEPETIYVPCGQMKRLTIHFAAGEEQEDVDLAMRAIGDGRIDVTPWLGGRIGLDRVGESLEAMNDPASPIRVVVDPRQLTT